jgi:hypothetical protein
MHKEENDCCESCGSNMVLPPLCLSDGKSIMSFARPKHAPIWGALGVWGRTEGNGTTPYCIIAICKVNLDVNRWHKIFDSLHQMKYHVFWPLNGNVTFGIIFPIMACRGAFSKWALLSCPNLRDYFRQLLRCRQALPFASNVVFPQVKHGETLDSTCEVRIFVYIIIYYIIYNYSPSLNHSLEWEWLLLRFHLPSFTD